MSITPDMLKVGLKIRPTICSNWIYTVIKVTNTFAWIRRTPALPYESDFKYRKNDLTHMEMA